MYLLRFRNRNARALLGVRKVEQFSTPGGSCGGAGPSWTVTAQSVDSPVVTTVDTIDDVGNDPPDRKLGPAGYKFHPMIRTIASVTGGATSVWTVQYIAKTCANLPTQHNVQVRRIPGGNQGINSSNLHLPLMGASDEHLDYSQLPYPNAMVAQLRDLAETACLAQRGKLGDTNLWETLSEVDRSLGTVRDLLQRARNIQSIAFYGRKGSSRARQFTNESAGQYLATRYGFQPLVKDIEAILVGLEKPLGKRLHTTRTRQVWSETTNSPLSDMNDSGHVVFTRTLTRKQSLVVKAMSLDSVDITLFGALGLGFKDLWALPLELTTLSFVGDWFANIGDFVSALAPDVGFSNVGSCTTVEWECEETITFGVKGLDPSKVGVTTIAGITPPSPVTRRIYRKERFVGLQGPTLQWKLDFKFSNPVRVLDAVALIASLTARTKADLKPSPMDEILRLRRRNPSQRGRRSQDDYRNASDRGRST